MTVEQLYAAIWSKKLDGTQAPPHKQSIDRVRWIAELFDDRDNGPLLDIGCGSGAMLAEANRRGVDSLGLDVDASVVDWLRQHEANARVWNVDVHGVPPVAVIDNAEHPWGTITLADVIEHLFSPYEVLRQCRDKLREGGRIFVGTPNCANWRRVLSLMRGAMFRTSGDDAGRDGGHIGYYAPHDLAAALTGAGFREVRVHLRNLDPMPAELVPVFRNLGADIEHSQTTYLVAEGTR